VRRHLTFRCEGDTLAATLDRAPGSAGLLWVGGGNEIRSGAFAGQAQLAARIAAAGYPVLRFDRRGVGDSEGENRGFTGSAPDIAAALTAFRQAQPAVSSVIAFGNCDAASALALNGGNGFAGLVLANLWTIEADDEAPPPAAIRARYAGKLKDPREWLRLVRGQVSLGKLARGLARAAAPAPAPTSLARQIADGLARFRGPVRILIAGRDRTGQAFLAGWDARDPRLAHCPRASHAFVEPEARAWLFDQLVGALADEQARQLDVG
jgi:exosortase A-associated hydrolase 1